MQTQLLEIKELLSVWYLVVLENKIFVAALVVAVWICFSILYSIKASFLKKKIKVTEQKSSGLQEQLNSAEQKIKANDVILATAEQQMEEEQQATVEFNKKISERHQQVVEKIRELARNFDLSEQLVGPSDSIANEIIWQQQDNMVSQLTEKLTAEKNVTSALQVAHKDEINRMSEADSSVGIIKDGLDVLTKQVSKLELSALEQSNQQETLKNELQKQLINSLEKNQVEIVELISKLTLQENVKKITEEPQAELKASELGEIVEANDQEKVPEIIVESEPVQVTGSIVEAEEPVRAPELTEMPAPILEAETVKIDIPVISVEAKTSVKSVESIAPKAVTAPAAEVVDEVQVVPVKKQEKPEAVKKKGEKNKILGFTKSLFSTKGLKKMPKQVVPAVKEVKQTEEIMAATSESESDELSRKREEPAKLKKSDYTGGKGIDLKGKFKGLLSKKKKK